MEDENKLMMVLFVALLILTLSVSKTVIRLHNEIEQKNQQIEELEKIKLGVVIEPIQLCVKINKEQEVKVEEEIAPETIEEEWQSLGNFKITAYCPCKKCCGKTDGITATGTKATARRTIGVNTAVIPYGSEIKIGDNIYIAEDTGGGIGKYHIDLFMDSHKDALNYGVHYEEVFIKCENGK